jgi:hypothetical protein
LKSRYDKILEIKTPTFIQFGSLTVQSDFSKDIPKAKSKTYEGIGALPMIESPEQTAKDVIHFLDS